MEKRIDLYVILPLITLIFLSFRFYFTLDSPPIVGNFEPDLFVRVLYIFENNHLYTEKIPHHTYFSNVGNVAAFFPMDALFYTLSVIMGFEGFRELIVLNRLLPIQTVVLIPLFSIVFYKQLTIIYGQKTQTLDYVIIWLFASAGTTYLISFAAVFARNALYSWAFVIMVFYLLFKSHENHDKRIYALLFTFATLVIIFKFTVGMMFLIILFVVLILTNSWLTLKKEYTIRKSFASRILPLFIISTAVFLFRFGYQVPHRLRGTLDTLTEIVSSSLTFLSEPYFMITGATYEISQMGFVSQKSFSPFEELAYNFLSDIGRITIHIIPLVIPLAFMFTCLYIFFRKKKTDQYLLILCSAFFSFPILVLGFYKWMGLWQVFYRVNQPFSIISILFLAYLLVNYRIKVREYHLNQFLTILIIVSVVSSCYLVATGHAESFTKPEYIGIDWFGSNIDNNEPVFTDFRIGTPLVLYNFTDVHGINFIEYPKEAKTMYEKTYQEVSQKNLDYLMQTVENKKKSKPDYFLFSEEMTKDKIQSPGPKFSPAKDNFLKEYDELTLKKIYCNEEIKVYEN